MAETEGGMNAGYGMLIAQGVANTITALGSFGITKHQNAIARAQANIARLNAQTMELQAQSVFRRAENEQMKVTMQAGKVKHSQRAALAANGIAVGEGSAAELQASTDIVKEIESNQIKSNATRDAWGYRMKATQYEGQALMSEASKRNKWEVFGTTLMSGAAQVASSYMLMDAQGMFGEAQSTANGPANVTNSRGVALDSNFKLMGAY